MDAASIGVLVLALVIVLALSFVAYWMSPYRKRKGEKGEDAGSDKRWSRTHAAHGDAEEGNAAVPPGSADHVGGKEAVAAPPAKDAGNGEAKDGDDTEKVQVKSAMPHLEESMDTIPIADDAVKSAYSMSVAALPPPSAPGPKSAPMFPWGAGSGPPGGGGMGGSLKGTAPPGNRDAITPASRAQRPATITTRSVESSAPTMPWATPGTAPIQVGNAEVLSVFHDPRANDTPKAAEAAGAGADVARNQPPASIGVGMHDDKAVLRGEGEMREWNFPEAEVRRFAAHLGILQGEDDLLWVAEGALSAPLPANWEERCDPQGKAFFSNRVTGVVTWVHPLEHQYRTLLHREREAARRKDRSSHGAGVQWEDDEDDNVIEAAYANGAEADEVEEFNNSVESFEASSLNVSRGRMLKQDLLNGVLSPRPADDVQGRPDQDHLATPPGGLNLSLSARGALGSIISDGSKNSSLKGERSNISIDFGEGLDTEGSLGSKEWGSVMATGAHSREMISATANGIPLVGPGGAAGPGPMNGNPTSNHGRAAAHVVGPGGVPGDVKGQGVPPPGSGPASPPPPPMSWQRQLSSNSSHSSGRGNRAGGDSPFPHSGSISPGPGVASQERIISLPPSLQGTPPRTSLQGTPPRTSLQGTPPRTMSADARAYASSSHSPDGPRPFTASLEGVEDVGALAARLEYERQELRAKVLAKRRELEERRAMVQGREGEAAGPGPGAPPPSVAMSYTGPGGGGALPSPPHPLGASLPPLNDPTLGVSRLGGRGGAGEASAAWASPDKNANAKGRAGARSVDLGSSMRFMGGAIPTPPGPASFSAAGGGGAIPTLRIASSGEVVGGAGESAAREREMQLRGLLSGASATAPASLHFAPPPPPPGSSMRPPGSRSHTPNRTPAGTPPRSPTPSGDPGVGGLDLPRWAGANMPGGSVLNMPGGSVLNMPGGSIPAPHGNPKRPKRRGNSGRPGASVSEGAGVEMPAPPPVAPLPSLP